MKLASLNTDEPADFVTILNLVLADECLLYTKTRNCHWTVTSPQFRELQDLFERQYDELAGIIDQVAEQIRALGGQSMRTMSEFLQHAQLKEQPGGHPIPPRMIRQLLDDHEAIIRALRSDLAACAAESNGAGMREFLAGMLERHDKMAQALQARLENS